MASPSGGTSSRLDERLRELEREAVRLRDKRKKIDRAVRKSGVSLSTAVAHRTRLPPPPRAPLRPPAEAPPGIAPSPKPGEEFFEWKPRKELEGIAGEGGAHAPEERTRPLDRNRFANYFSSGGFIPSGSGIKDRGRQRNQAIFVLILLAVISFLVIRVMFF